MRTGTNYMLQRMGASPNLRQDFRYFFFNFMGRGGGSAYSIFVLPALAPFGPGSSAK